MQSEFRQADTAKSRLPCEEGADRWSLEYLQARAIAAVGHWIERANEFGTDRGRPRVAMPEVVFNLRGGCAGQAVYPVRGAPFIRVNADLLRRYPTHMISQTMPHEVAHIVVRAWFPQRTRPHGQEWQSVMRMFGKAPNRTHSLVVVPARSVRQYRFLCGCAERVRLVSERRAKNLMRGIQAGRPGRCTTCKEPVKFDGEFRA